MEDRYFLVTLGPTGSGKSVLKTIVSKFFKQIPKSQDSGGTVKVLVNYYQENQENQKKY